MSFRAKTVLPRVVVREGKEICLFKASNASHDHALLESNVNEVTKAPMLQSMHASGETS